MENKRYYLLTKIFWFFMFGCMFGYFFEVILDFIKKGYFVNHQGLIYGPFIVPYGLGALVFLMVLKIKKPIKIFLYSALIDGLLEFTCSYVQEKIFHSISWDYSRYMFNIEGRTSLYHMFFWGLFSLIFIVDVYSKILKLIDKVYGERFIVITFCIFLFMVFNITISSLASIRQDERHRNIRATDIVDRYLDEHYPDSRMEKIFTNKVIIDNSH